MKHPRRVLALAAFFLPVIAFAAILAIERFAPFGGKSLLIMDMNNQYVEFFNGLKSGCIWFSWSKSLGTDYLGVFAYYVSSPFSLLTLLFPNRLMHYGVLLLTAVKLGCASLTSRYFFERCGGVKGAMSLLFSVSYSLMGYCMAYSLSVMWLDGLIWLPVILLGTERILRGESPLLFLVSLFVCFFSTYYISYMIVLFSCLYFVMRAVEDRTQRFIRRGLIFAASGILAAGLAGAFLVPTFLSHFEGKLVTAQMDYSSLTNFPFRELVNKLVFGGYDSITNSGSPSVYCGLIALWFALSFFARERISLRSKLCRAVLLALMAVSLWFTPLDKVWHAFQYPNWFPYRYAFLFSFVLLDMAARSWAARERNDNRWLVLSLLILSLADMSWNGVRTLRGLDREFRYVDEADYVSFQDEKRELLNAVPEEGFVRVRSAYNTDRTMNDAVGFGYNGTTHYSSSYLAAVNSWVHSFGMAQGWIWCSDFGSTPVTDLFLDEGWAISDRLPGPFYELAAENELAGIYRSQYSGSLGYFVPADRAGWADAYDPFDDQNTLFYMLTGETEVYHAVQASSYSEAGGTGFSVVSDGDPLFVWFTKQDSKAPLYVNGEYVCELFSGETDCIWFLGTYPQGETVSVYVGADYAEGHFRSLDAEVFARGADELDMLSLKKVSGSGKVTGEIDCPEDGIVLTSIPYSSGWTVRVDGVRTVTAASLDTFVAFPVSAGSHSVTLRYTPPGFAAGLALTVVSAALIAGGVLWQRRKQRLPDAE